MYLFLEYQKLKFDHAQKNLLFTACVTFEEFIKSFEGKDIHVNPLLVFHGSITVRIWYTENHTEKSNHVEKPL